MGNTASDPILTAADGLLGNDLKVSSVSPPLGSPEPESPSELQGNCIPRGEMSKPRSLGSPTTSRKTLSASPTKLLSDLIHSLSALSDTDDKSVITDYAQGQLSPAWNPSPQAVKTVHSATKYGDGYYDDDPVSRMRQSPQEKTIPSVREDLYRFASPGRPSLVEQPATEKESCNNRKSGNYGEKSLVDSVDSDQDSAFTSRVDSKRGDGPGGSLLDSMTSEEEDSSISQQAIREKPSDLEQEETTAVGGGQGILTVTSWPKKAPRKEKKSEEGSAATWPKTMSKTAGRNEHFEPASRDDHEGEKQGGRVERLVNLESVPPCHSEATPTYSEQGAKKGYRLQDPDGGRLPNNGNPIQEMERNPFAGETKDMEDLRSMALEVQKSLSLLAQNRPYYNSSYGDGVVSNKSISMQTAKSNNDDRDEDIEIDLVFVQKYEEFFNDFLWQNPSLEKRNPKLLDNLKVVKLQKLLEAAVDAETKLQNELDNIKKCDKAGQYQARMIEVSRNSVMQETQLQAELDETQNALVIAEGYLTWQFLALCNRRVKKQQQWLKKLFDTETDADILALLPDVPLTQPIRIALAAHADETMPATAREEELRHFQVENAFLNAEVHLLERKLAEVEAEAKKFSWVDSVFMRLDGSQMMQLRQEYQKKIGVEF